MMYHHKLEACGSISYPQAQVRDGQMPGVFRDMLRFRIGRHKPLPATNRRDIWDVKDLAEDGF